MSKTETTPPETTKPPRDQFAVGADLESARARFKVLEPLNRDHALKRQRALDRRDRLRAKHDQENPGHPFDADLYTPPATVPGPDTPETREFYRLHYAIADLEIELAAAKARSRT